MRDGRNSDAARLKARAQAETLALQALGWLCAEPDRAERFLAMTGLAPGELRASARDAAFLAGVLDHLLADETLLLAFCADTEAEPPGVGAARRHLPGASPDA
ncbi:MAG: DUF3572 domain-containing protein [Alphaproteobacteria bacterium]|nr:DUF3572 domain-containing protein [Alphaproteobacteria bacterium]